MNGSFVQSGSMASPEPLRQAQQPALSGAEKYEDDKRRLTTSCFSKKDEKGVLLQTYITHIRVEEDGAFPSEPPPLNANPTHKKQRAVVVAVKSSGRVWMHKARENADGSFQIGKSWPLEELQSIEAYSPTAARSAEEKNMADLAGPAGFSITMQKPYFWKAHTAREKDFFIQSIVKIFRKYTKGNVPDLTGFDDAQRAHLLGSTAPPPQQAEPLPAPTASSTFDPSLQPPSLRTVSAQRPPSASTNYNDRYGGRDTSAAPTESHHRAPSPLRSRNISTNSYGQAASPPPDSTIAALSPTKNGASPSVTTQKLTPQTSQTIMAERDASYGSRQRQVTEPVNTPPDSLDTPLPERRRPPMNVDSAYGGTMSLRSVDEPKPLMPRGPRPKESKTSVGDQADQMPAPLDTTPRQSSAALDGESRHIPTSLQPARNGTPSQDEGLNRGHDDEDELYQSEDGPKYRPGLGPMTGGATRAAASEVANKFRKAAAAATAFNKPAFKPRAGGAGARLLAQKDKQSDDEGVTNVFKAPPRTTTTSTDNSIMRTPDDKEGPLLPEQIGAEAQPSVTVTSPISPVEGFSTKRPTFASTPEPETTPEQNREREIQSQRMAAERKARKRRSDMYAKCFAKLEIDSSVLRGREGDFEDALADFGWDNNVLQSKRIEAMESDLRREISRLEAGAWLGLGQTDQKDERLQSLEKMLDKAISECDEMEGLLTLYSVELNTLNDDIQFIETQSQGLQVQTANQRLLHNELQNLINTVSIGAHQLQPLKQASPADARGLEAIEACLVLLHKALNTIDPLSLRGRAVISANRFTPKTDFTTMRALQDKKDLYINEALAFNERLKNYMSSAYGAALMETQDAVKRRTRDMKGIDVSDHEVARRALWQYSPLMLFTRDVDLGAWNTMIQLYAERARPIFLEEFRESINGWKRTAKKPSKEEQAALFTAQENESQSLTTTARKLTIKRSQNLVSRGLKSGSLEKKGISVDKNQSDKLWPFDTFTGALEEIVPIISTEQNFIIDFFHAATMVDVEFVDSVNHALPDQRRLPNLFLKKAAEPDRKMAMTISEAMEQIFSTLPTELQSLFEWALSSSELNVVGILSAIERARVSLEDSNQEYLGHVLLNMQTRLNSIFTRFIDDQIRAIEDTKVKSKKRKGVISFVRVFPNFAEVMESMLPPADSSEKLEIRSMVGDAYNRINKAMFDCLKFIAKESPVAGLTQSADPDDKEALNYHILLIENMHHYVSEVPDRSDQILNEWRGRAQFEMTEHMSLYVNAVIRRPLGKLLDFLESTESLMSSVAMPSQIAQNHASHSRSMFKKIMASFTAKDVRKGVDGLRARVEKHFGDGDEPALSQKLVATILQECERKYQDACERTKRISDVVYERTVETDFRSGDIQAAFRR